MAFFGKSRINLKFKEMVFSLKKTDCFVLKPSCLHSYQQQRPRQGPGKKKQFYYKTGMSTPANFQPTNHRPGVKTSPRQRVINRGKVVRHWNKPRRKPFQQKIREFRYYNHDMKKPANFQPSNQGRLMQYPPYRPVQRRRVMRHWEKPQPTLQKPRVPDPPQTVIQQRKRWWQKAHAENPQVTSRRQPWIKRWWTEDYDLSHVRHTRICLEKTSDSPLKSTRRRRFPNVLRNLKLRNHVTLPYLSLSPAFDLNKSILGSL